MVVRHFPPPQDTDEHGLLAIGGDLEVETLLSAYSRGIFPWPVRERLPIPWFCPPQRALLFLDELHVPRSLARAIRRNRFSFKFDSQCASVIAKCAAARNRTGQRGTWITPSMVRAYTALHAAGHCHSTECYDAAESLVGGLYGVAIGHAFAAESMFRDVDDAGKACLVQLALTLKTQGARWIDCQQLTPVTAQLGAREVAREEFLALLEDAIAKPKLQLK